MNNEWARSCHGIDWNAITEFASRDREVTIDEPVRIADLRVCNPGFYEHQSGGCWPLDRDVTDTEKRWELVQEEKGRETKMKDDEKEQPLPRSQCCSNTVGRLNLANPADTTTTSPKTDSITISVLPPPLLTRFRTQFCDSVCICHYILSTCLKLILWILNKPCNITFSPKFVPHRKQHCLFEVSQASPVSPPDNSSVKIKMRMEEWYWLGNAVQVGGTTPSATSSTTYPK